MKITPYLLYLNGFDIYAGRINCWRKIEWGKHSEHVIEIQVEPAAIQGLWLVQYNVTGVRCPVSCSCYLKTWQDLVDFSKLFERNHEGYTNVKPIKIKIPEIYTHNNWERGIYDQVNFDVYKYSYKS